MKFSKLMGLTICLFSSLGYADNIITTGGTITEIVYELGAGNHVVATDTSSTYPQAAKNLPKVGYYRDLAAEGVLSMSPKQIFALEGTGRPQVIKQIEATGVNVNYYKKPVNVEGLYRLISKLGDDLNKQQQAKALVKKIKTSLPKKQKLGKTKAIFVLSAGERGIIAAGQETVPSLLFSYTGITNIGKLHKGYKALNTEFLAVNQPDFIVAPFHVVMGAGGKQTFCKQPALRLFSAAKKCNVLVLDGLLSLGMTPRLATAIKQVSDYKEALINE
ncbi:MAG: heme/hemin ABC transporter substrate-binding protein [Parashewanella sp.]